jgi:hypothetical protein
MAVKNKTKIRITVTILPSINNLLEKVCKRSGLSKSLLVEQSIKDFLQERLEEDSKALANIKFDDLPSEDEWSDIQSKIA